MNINKGILYILRGVPGCGKSTLANSLNGVVCEADQYWITNGVYKFDPAKLPYAHNYCKANVEHAMIEGEPRIIVSNTSVKESDLEPYYKLAKLYNYKVFSLIVENRHSGSNIHNVPVVKLEEMEQKLRNSIKLI